VDICGDDSHNTCSYPVDIRCEDSYTTCSCLVDICGDDSHTTCSCPVDICYDDSHTHLFMSWTGFEFRWLKIVALLDRVIVARVVYQACDIKLLHLLDTEDGGNALLRNVGNFTSRHVVICQKIVRTSNLAAKSGEAIVGARERVV
jgi:hypothetical protein